MARFNTRDYAFMKQLRADNSENRENMTIKLTEKMLDTKRTGKRLNIADIALKISQKMAASTGEVAAKNTKKGEQTEAEDELEAEKKRRLDSLGPPGFYDADLKNYLQKFDLCLQQRKEFKQRMRSKMAFTNSEWNHNVEKESKGTEYRQDRQIIKIVNGVTHTLKQKEYEKAGDYQVAHKTFIKA